jgi:hypothetical protein
LLLKNARPAFDIDGEWMKQNRVAFIVLNLLAGRLFRQPFEAGGPSETLKETLAEIIDALTARSDAIPLGYAWLQRVLMSPGKSRRRPAMRSDSDLTTHLLLVAATLAVNLAPHPSPLKWIEAELYVWRNWRVYALLAVEVSRQPVNKSAITDLIGQVLLNDLASSVLIERLASEPTIERKIISNAIAQIPNLADWFTDLWKRFFGNAIVSDGFAIMMRHVRISGRSSSFGEYADWSSWMLQMKRVRFGSHCMMLFVKASSLKLFANIMMRGR